MNQISDTLVEFIHTINAKLNTSNAVLKIEFDHRLKGQIINELVQKIGTGILPIDKDTGHLKFMGTMISFKVAPVKQETFYKRMGEEVKLKVDLPSTKPKENPELDKAVASLQALAIFGSILSDVFGDKERAKKLDHLGEELGRKLNPKSDTWSDA